jgi:hypothetical protein
MKRRTLTSYLANAIFPMTGWLADVLGGLLLAVTGFTVASFCGLALHFLS